VRRVLVIQHSDESPLGVMAPVLGAAGLVVEVIDGEDGCRLPDDAADASGLILLGGAMSANDDGRCPHFPDLLQLIRSFTAAAKPVLGVCLGGQLIARAMGGRVIEQARGEYGFTALHGREGVAHDPVLGGLELPAHIMQWHNDHFTLPPQAEHLLESEACPGLPVPFRGGRDDRRPLGNPARGTRRGSGSCASHTSGFRAASRTGDGFRQGGHPALDRGGRLSMIRPMPQRQCRN
jgi:GMP synthase-like glutamine amidotransferase